MSRRIRDMDGGEPALDFLEAEPDLASGDHIFVHETGRNHLVWQMTGTGRPVVLIEGRFRALPRDEYLPLAFGGL